MTKNKLPILAWVILIFCAVRLTAQNTGAAYENGTTFTPGHCLQAGTPTGNFYPILDAGAACGTGSGSITLQTNGVNNTSQTTLNFVSPATFNSLTFTFSNPTTGNETFTVGGTLGNAGLTNSAITIAGTSVALGGSTVSFPSPGAIGGTTPAAGNFTTLGASGLLTASAAGAASTPGFTVTGAPFTAGTSTTNFPQSYLNCAGAIAPTTFSTAGTMFGINACSGFTGNLFDFYTNGGTSIASLSATGTLTLSGSAHGITLPQGSGPGIIANDLQFAPPASVQASGLQLIFPGTETAASSLIVWGSAASHIQTGTLTTVSSFLATNAVPTTTGTFTAGDCVKVSSGTGPVLADQGAACGSGGGITFPQTVAGTTTSGGVPYFSSGTVLSSSGLLTQFGVVLGGGAGGAPTSTAAGAAGTLLTGNGAAAPTFIDFPQVDDIPSANCNNTTAGAGWSIGSGGTVTCRAGTNNLGGFIAITDTTTTFAQFSVAIPEDWDSATDPYIRFQIASTDVTSGHTIIPQIKVSCAKGDGTTTDDVTFNAAHSASTITLNTTANQFWSNSSVQLNATDMTGCVAGGMMVVQVGRATDTATSAEFYRATMTFPRKIVVQAN